MLLGCVYIPPENTKYTSNESFTETETEMLSLSNKYDCYTSLIGDMNAKTKLLEDVTVPDDSLFEILDEFDNQSLTGCLLSTTIVLFSYPKLLSFSVLTFIK
jgi:hypothetical protein